MNEELKTLWGNLTDEQKARAEEIYQKKRDALFAWHDTEYSKAVETLKRDGRYKKGLDTNSEEPEIKELSAEYRRRFNALPEVCIMEAAGEK